MLINECLMAILATDPLSDNVAPGTAVIVYQTDHTALIVKGIISEHAHQAPFDGINITPKCIVVEIQEVGIVRGMGKPAGLRSWVLQVRVW